MKNRCTFCWTSLSLFPTMWSTINGDCCPLCYKAYYEPRMLPIRWLKEPTDTEPGTIEFIDSEADKAIEDEQRKAALRARQEMALASMGDSDMVALALDNAIGVKIRILQLPNLSAQVARQIFQRTLGGGLAYVMAEEFMKNPVAPLLFLEDPGLGEIVLGFQGQAKTLAEILK